jgi:hypothetical protein
MPRLADALAVWVAWLLVSLLLAAAAAALGITVRRILLERGGGNVECGLRRGPGQRWRLGIAAYRPDELRWFSAFGVRLRPNAVFARSAMLITGRRPVTDAEAVSVGRGTVIVECRLSPAGGRGGQRRAPADPVEFAMAEGALTGFLAWLESAPPGRMADLG